MIMANTAAYLHQDYLHQEQSQDLCAHAIEQSEKASRALARSEAICRAHGVRLTPIRRNVLEALYSSHKPLGAYDLADILTPNGRRTAPITIYRALDFLIEQGLAHRLASQNAYIASFHGDSSQETTAFLICEECGGVDETSSSEFADTLSGLLNSQEFQCRAKILEIIGRCSHCR
jgi:Fur family transcriptional regulator, zinc uptake regulator